MPRWHLLVPFAISLALGALGLNALWTLPDPALYPTPVELQAHTPIATPPPGALPDAWFPNTLYESQRDGALLVLAGIVLVATLLQLVNPAHQRRIRASVLFYFGYLSVLPLCGILVASLRLEAYGYVRGFMVFCQAITVTNLMAVSFFDVVLSVVKVPSRPIIRDLITGAAYVVATVSVLTRAGVNLAGALTPTAVVGAVVALSIQSTLGDAVCGIFIELEDSIEVGDWIRVGDLNGEVKEIRWRHTAIETKNWETVLIPNSVLMKTNVLVLGRRAGQPLQQRRWLYFTVDFRHPPAEVIAAVEDALRAAPIPRVAADPPANCLLFDFREHGCYYAVRYWLTELLRTDTTDSVVRVRIHYALRRAGIPLALPRREVRMTEEDAAATAAREEAERADRVHALRRFKLFEPLTEAELTSLVPALRHAPFVKGEVMTRQGADANWLYLLLRGRAKVQVATPQGGTQVVAQLADGDFFGEMALLTGEKRSASVIAETECDCWRLGREGFSAIVKARPEIASELSRVLAERVAELQAAVGGGQTTKQTIDAAAKKLTAEISAFFGLDAGG